MEWVTERCVIRNFRPDDAGDLVRILSDERVMRYIEPAFDMEKTRTFIREAGMCEPPLVYAIVRKATGKVIGHAIFHACADDSYEIGWILDRNFWGMGIADEVTKALVKYARMLKVGSCVIECVPEQTASRKIALRNGFVHEGQADSLDRYRLVLG